MEDDERRARGASFGSVAAEYARHRPAYPEQAVGWLIGDAPATVLELGAGTGKLTASVCALGHRVLATDPDEEMLAQLREAAPEAVILASTAEEIPLRASSVDVVVASQAFHWFDADRAWPEIARVLRPGGSLALVWNSGDVRVPWVRKVLSLVDSHRDHEGWDPFAESTVFELTERTSVKHWQEFKRETLLGFVASSSKVATSSRSEREQILSAVDALYESYGRGPDGLLMPWIANCYRGKVAGLDAASAQAAAITAEPGNGDETVVISFS
ncbi:MAG TPA: class I SAM-dependent methyltransferase [Pseudonocardia sp.]|jgi:ubiquinone/menaquinone biosynthesis C-methylase UbiE|nr:class I SAM-dependent methyltransferase [Pseudonocardia sp.]